MIVNKTLKCKIKEKEKCPAVRPQGQQSGLRLQHLSPLGREDPPIGEGLIRGGIKGTSPTSEGNQTCTHLSLYPLFLTLFIQSGQAVN